MPRLGNVLVTAVIYPLGEAFFPCETQKVMQEGGEAQRRLPNLARCLQGL